MILKNTSKPELLKGDAGALRACVRLAALFDFDPTDADWTADGFLSAKFTADQARRLADALEQGLAAVQRARTTSNSPGCPGGFDSDEACALLTGARWISRPGYSVEDCGPWQPVRMFRAEPLFWFAVALHAMAARGAFSATDNAKQAPFLTVRVRMLHGVRFGPPIGDVAQETVVELPATPVVFEHLSGRAVPILPESQGDDRAGA